MYGFYDRLNSSFPSQVIVDITEVCNLACVHCPHPTFKESQHYGARYLEPELSAKLVDEIREHGRGITQYIRYTSDGEPLVHPQAYDILQYAVQQSGTFVTLTTNGTIMNEKRTMKLLASGIHMIDISIDAVRPETYAKIRRGGELEVTRSNVLNLIRWVRKSGSPTKVVVSFVQQPDNVSEAAEFESFWRSHGVANVAIRKLHSHAGAVSNIAQRIHFANREADRRPCLYPWERITLNPRGELAFCPQDWVHGSAIADYRSTTVRDTWSGATLRALREAHINNDFSAHSFCGQCPDWRNTNWPGEGRSYSDLVREVKAAGV